MITTTTTMLGPAFDASAASNGDDPRNGGRLQGWTPAGAARPLVLGDRTVGPANSPRIYVVTGPQTSRGTPPPIVGARVVSAALWVMFATAICNTIAF